jgi:DNA polymerase III delta prime subunit
MENDLLIYKFQPLYFTDFEIEQEIVDVLNTLIQIDNLNVLLTGDIGSGKTALLNSLIREYYKNYNSSDYENNILYINNLKEQGINYYRNDVKTFCQTCSTIKNKKKLVILDELDLINEQSQQVFRNFIDKYSHNVHFIASCCNIQKIIESLQSRFNIIKIKPMQRTNLYKIMNKIKQHENITIDEDAAEFILNVCNNTAKILINYMEKFKLLNQRITLDLATKVCTNINFFTFEEYNKYLKIGDLKKAVKLLYDIHDKGYSVMDILDNYFLFIKTEMTLSEDEKYKVIPLICKYITIFHNVHEDEIELALFTNNLIKVLE